jgi:hypothetical protein
VEIEEGTAIVVTTKHRGVFFGRFVRAFEGGKHIELKDARNCLYWSSDVRGFLGLAASGPDKSSRVGPAVDIPQLRDVTCTAKCSKEAIMAWEAGPWS